MSQLKEDKVVRNFYTSDEVRELLHCSKSELTNRINNDGFPSPLKFSYAGKAPSRTTMRRFPREEVDAWFQDKETEARQGRQAYVPVYSLKPRVQPDAPTANEEAEHFKRLWLSCKDELEKAKQAVVAPPGRAVQVTGQGWKEKISAKADIWQSNDSLVIHLKLG